MVIDNGVGIVCGSRRWGGVGQGRETGGFWDNVIEQQEKKGKRKLEDLSLCLNFAINQVLIFVKCNFSQSQFQQHEKFYGLLNL